MGAYILRRLLLVIPTLFGVMLINFALTQFVPGGPVEQVLARLEGEGDAIQNLAGTEGGGIQEEQAGAGYVGARGLPPEFLAKLEIQFGFSRIVCAEGFTGTPSLDAPECVKEAIPATERFLIMMGNYLTFDFGESYFRSISVVDLVLEKMPVSITLGLWSTLIAYLISIPLGIRKAVHDGSSLIIEFIFSLDGLGQLGYRAAVERDYPVIFGTLFAFGLIGLIVGIISDMMYVLVDPRIDFERRG